MDHTSASRCLVLISGGLLQQASSLIHNCFYVHVLYIILYIKTCLLNLWNDHKTLHFLEPIHTCRQKTLLVLMIMNKYIFMTDIIPMDDFKIKFFSLPWSVIACDVWLNALLIKWSICFIFTGVLQSWDPA